MVAVVDGKRVTAAPTSGSSFWPCLRHHQQYYCLPWVEEEAPQNTWVDRAYWEWLEEEEVQSPYRRLRAVEERIQCQRSS
jgi:hypothetical protein